MNKEFKIINKDNSASKIPNRLNDDIEREYLTRLTRNIGNLLEAANNKDLEENITILTENIYIILSMLSEMNIQPDYFFKKIVEFKLSVTWYGGEKKKDAKGKNIYPEIIKVPYKEIRNELELMKDYNYYGGDNDIEKNYYAVLELYKKRHLRYNSSPTAISHQKINEHFYKYIDEIYRILNSIDLLDVVCALMNLLYEDISMFVEMGVNPKESLAKYIDMNSEKTRTKTIAFPTKL